jgi:hypothetical protein
VINVTGTVSGLHTALHLIGDDHRVQLLAYQHPGLLGRSLPGHQLSGLHVHVRLMPRYGRSPSAMRGWPRMWRTSSTSAAILASATWTMSWSRVTPTR